jgi:hypothetical protein
VVGSCEGGNEPLGSIKCGGVSRVAENQLFSEEGLCFMELVSCLVD